MINFEIVLLSIAILAGLIALTFWAAMVVHCFKNRELPAENRLLWLVVVFGKLPGAGAYYLLKYRRRPSATGPCYQG